MPQELSPEATKLINAALRASKRHGADAQSPSKAETYLIRAKELRDYVAQLEARVAGLEAWPR